MSNRKHEPKPNNLWGLSGESADEEKRSSPHLPPTETPQEETERRRVVIPDQVTPPEEDPDRNPNQQDHLKKKGK